ncbi:MAG: type I 3-dehydroquinate dehydratase [Thermodesulfobacteriota bacterium]
MKLGGLTLGKAPLVCGVIVKSIDSGSVNRALKAGADLLEVRLDTFSKRGIKEIEAPLKRLRKRGVPLILTVRSTKEGGSGKLTDSERLAHFKKLLPLVDAVDIELGSGRILKKVIKAAHEEKKKVIVSYHNFTSTPKAEKLASLIKEARVAGADIIKLATSAKGKAELRRLAGLLTVNTDLIVIAMGRGGSASRVFFPMLGSLITYAGITGINAPGQLSITELRRSFKSFGFK